MLIQLYFLLVIIAIVFFIMGLKYAIESRNNRDNEEERPQKSGPIMYYFLLAILFFSISAGASIDIYTLDHTTEMYNESVEGNVTTYTYEQQCHECHIDASQFAYLWSGMAVFSFILMAIYMILNTFGK